MVLKNRVSRALFSLSSYHYYNIASCVSVLFSLSSYRYYNIASCVPVYKSEVQCCAVQQESQCRRELGFYCEDTTCIPLFHKSMHPTTYPSPTQTPPPIHPRPLCTTLHHTHTHTHTHTYIQSCLSVLFSPSVLLPSTSISQFLWVLYKLPATDKVNRWVQLAD